jgi:hypothetical protein
MRFALPAAIPLVLSTLLHPAQSPQVIPIESGEHLRAVNVVMTPVTYHGKRAIRVVEGTHSPNALGEAIAIVEGVTFQEGTIEVDLVGVPGPHAAPDDRGFVGLAFHIDSAADRFKSIYLRPTNGRTTDQVRRNHATQFTALPDWPWYRLRKELPGQYESYVDLVAGEWTAVKIEVTKTAASLYVNGSPQPVLVVTDMKDPAIRGALALWIGDGTEAYFSNLRVTPRAP